MANKQETVGKVNPEDSCIEIGYLEQVDQGLVLTSQFFPSKVGGKPAWLDLEGIPSVNDVTCKNCNAPLQFLLQLYCPIDNESTCFHRTIYIFCCRNGRCHQESVQDCFLVLRSQLPRINKYFSNEAPNREQCETFYDESLLTKWRKLCILCGLPGEKRCARCKSTYCCREHQVFDWRHCHRNCCTAGEVSCTSASRAFMFPQYEICIDCEDETDNKGESSSDEMIEYQRYAAANSANEISDDDIKDIDNQNNDELFLNFKEKIRLHPDQVLRYKRYGEPLLISKEDVPTESNIPPCPCGARRLFEFQVMPQLLHFLNIDSTDISIDWGTLIVYTCSDSCTGDADGGLTNAYMKEYVWRQNTT